MWHQIEQAISSETNIPFKIKEKEMLSAGLSSGNPIDFILTKPDKSEIDIS